MLPIFVTIFGCCISLVHKDNSEASVKTRSMETGKWHTNRGITAFLCWL